MKYLPPIYRGSGHHLVPAIFFFGMGASKVGNGASSWILHMVFIILTPSMWGFAFREWKGVSKKNIKHHPYWNHYYYSFSDFGGLR